MTPSSGTPSHRHVSSATRRRAKAEAAREAHLLRLRQRQATLLLNQSNLSDTDHDILMERGKFDIPSSRMHANVAEIVLFNPTDTPKAGAPAALRQPQAVGQNTVSSISMSYRLHELRVIGCCV
jgi:hypothetical protein